MDARCKAHLVGFQLLKSPMREAPVAAGAHSREKMAPLWRLKPKLWKPCEQREEVQGVTHTRQAAGARGSGCTHQRELVQATLGVLEMSTAVAAPREKRTGVGTTDGQGPLTSSSRRRFKNFCQRYCR